MMNKRLIGVDEIAKFAECNPADVVNWIRTIPDCPIQKDNGVLWVEKKEFKIWLKKTRPEINSQAWIKKPKSIFKNERRKRW